MGLRNWFDWNALLMLECAATAVFENFLDLFRCKLMLLGQSISFKNRSGAPRCGVRLVTCTLVLQILVTMASLFIVVVSMPASMPIHLVIVVRRLGMPALPSGFMIVRFY